MSKTQQNLMDAFAGESQANRKYLAYAKQADKEGLTVVAKLFRAAAEAETIHAHAHLRSADKWAWLTLLKKYTLTFTKKLLLKNWLQILNSIFALFAVTPTKVL